MKWRADTEGGAPSLHLARANGTKDTAINSFSLVTSDQGITHTTSLAFTVRYTPTVSEISVPRTVPNLRFIFPCHTRGLLYWDNPRKTNLRNYEHRYKFLY